MQQIPLAAIVSVPLFPVGIHKGIYIGDGEVIEYGKKPLAEVRIVCLERFSDGKPITILPDPPFCHPPEEVVRRAMHRLGERRYSVYSNNCEHFVHWAKCGATISPQAQSLKGISFAAAAVMLLMMIAG